VLGLNDEAVGWLENAADRGFINYPYIAEYDPFLATISQDERYKQLLNRIKYEWEHFEE
jgi:hypothetical protein